MKKLSAIFAILVVFAVTAYSQPQIVLHLTGGIDIPMSQLKGDVSVTADQQNTYVQKSGFNGGLDATYFLGKKRNVGITFSASYNAFKSDDYIVTGTTTPTYNGKINILSIGLGAEYAFMPKGKTNPFIGVEFTGNFFSGKTTATPAPAGWTDGTLKSASRFGIQGNFGVDFAFSKSIGAVIGARYNMANLIGKDSATSTVANEYTLQDKEYTVGTTTIAAKNIGYLQVYAGVSFYFNRPKTMKK